MIKELFIFKSNIISLLVDTISFNTIAKANMLNSNQVTDSLYTETDHSSVVPSGHVVQAKMQSAKLQYTFPDEKIRGLKNKGVIAQYPYFAPDRGYLKKAPKMTKADELYLRKFMEGRAHKDIARIDQTNLADRQYVR